MSILITGATGNLGSRILKKLLELDNDIVIIKRSFSNINRIKDIISNVKAYNIDKSNIKQVFEENQIDIVIHTATNYGKTGETTSKIRETNISFPSEILNLAIKYSTKAFINTGTLLDKNINLYALTKYNFDEYLQKCSNQIIGISICPDHIYNEFDNKFPNFILNQLLKGVPEINLTEGYQQRNFIYVEDLVDAYECIINNLHKLTGYNRFEVVTDEIVTIREFVLKCKELTKNNSTKINFGAIKYRKNEKMILSADNSKIKSLGWKYKYNLDDGIIKILKEESVL